MDRAEVFSRVRRAADRLEQEDRVLLELDSNERTLTHRLALYLDGEFPGWNVDCEYNRTGHDPKVLKLPVLSDVRTDDDEARTVFPDIIVHRRDTDKNLLVIEAKKSTSRHGAIDDRVKLRAYIDQLGYAHAMYVVFGTSGAPGIRVIEFVDTNA